MKFLTLACFAVVLACASASVIGIGGIGHGLVGHGIGIGHGIGLGVGHGIGLGVGHGLLGHGISHGLVGHAVAPVVGHVGVRLHVPGDGLEGQYIPSGLERHYDDGSYRPEHHLAGHGHIWH